MAHNKPKPITIVGKKLDPQKIETLARITGFVKRQAKKIKAFDILVALLNIVAQPGNSFECLAVKIGLISNNTISKQAVFKRANQNLVEFLKSVLAASVMQAANVKPNTKNKLFSYFNRVLIEDSTSIKLHSKLAKVFPGSGNQTGKKTATLKINAVFELLTGRFCSFALHPFTRNDQSAAPDILDIAQPFDLIIRDLGYFACEVFAQMSECSVFFSEPNYSGNKFF